MMKTMTDTQRNAIEKLKAQQEKQEKFSPAWGVAEQLMDICLAEPASADLINTDLDNPDMSIVRAEQKIKKFADELHKKSNGQSVFVPASESDRILREFYGLPARAENPNPGADPNPAPDEEKPLDLMDFLRG